MWKEFKEFVNDREAKQTLADIIKSVGIVAAALSIKGITSWAKIKAQELADNDTLVGYWREAKAFIAKSYRHLGYGVIAQIAIWYFLVFALLVKNPFPGNDPKSIFLIVFGLLASFAVRLLILNVSVKTHAVAEIAIAGGNIIKASINGGLKILPSFLRTQLEPAIGIGEAARSVYRISYIGIFFAGVIDIAIAVVSCLSLGSFHGAIVAAAILDFAMLGLGLRIGYNLKSDAARVWSFRFVLFSLATGFVILIVFAAVGPERLKAWKESKSIPAIKMDVEYNQRQAELVEANGLYYKIQDLEKQGGVDPKRLANMYDVRRWLMSDRINKGPRPVLMPDPPPACADGKDNNGNNLIDENDPACGFADTKCVLGYDVTYVKGPDNRPVLDARGNKTIASRKARLADGCRSFEGYDVPRRYDSRLNETLAPKPDPPRRQASNTNGVDGRVARDTRRETVAVIPAGSTASGRAGKRFMEKYGQH